MSLGLYLRWKGIGPPYTKLSFPEPHKPSVVVHTCNPSTQMGRDQGHPQRHRKFDARVGWEEMVVLGSRFCEVLQVHRRSFRNGCYINGYGGNVEPHP